MWKIWLILSGVFLIIEIINLGFYMFWFSLGALIAMVSSFFIKNTIIQVVIFLVSSTILLFATKPLVNKILPKESLIKTNSFAMEGKMGKVTQNIEPIEGKGQVKVNGETWSAKSYNNEFIEKDTEVIVEKIDGVKLIVKPVTSSNN